MTTDTLRIDDLLPVPYDRRPMPTAEQEFAKCGNPANPTGRIVAYEYDGQRGDWPVYEQFGHAVAICCYTQKEGNLYLRLARQWRIVDSACVELPAGRIVVEDLVGPDAIAELLKRVLKETIEEVGMVNLTGGWLGRGISHDVGREVAQGGGPKAFIPCVLMSDALTAPHSFEDGDEKVGSWFEPMEHVLGRVQSGEIHDSIARLFIPASYRLVRGNTDEWDKQWNWHSLDPNALSAAMIAASE